MPRRQRSPAAAPWLLLLHRSLLAGAVIFFALHFLHLRADFPNNSRWTDWSKYTDEGWYGDAAIRHFLLGHWRVPGDFNPAVALPVWPLLLGLVFHFTGVSLLAARALTVSVFGATLVAVYALLRRFTPSNSSLAPALTVFLLALSPFFFVFDRLAILEPLLALLTVLALLVASFLAPSHPHTKLQNLWPGLALGILLPAMVLTKTTAVALIPSVAAMLWYRAGHRLRPALRLALVPATLALALWAAYFFLGVRPHFLADFQYLFSANAYTGFQLQPLATVLFQTVADAQWIGPALFFTFCAGLLAAVVFRPAIFGNPLVVALLLWIGGYFAFLAYHYNLQPRYYLVPAIPITMLTAMLLDEFQAEFRLPAQASTASRPILILRPILVAVLIAAIALPDALLQLHFLRHPEYTFLSAANNVAAIVRSTPGQSPLILSVSGSDLSLMTRLPSIDDDFGTIDLDHRVQQYRPGWYLAWNQIDDDKMDALSPLYTPVRIASFPVMDDPERNQLILYRLDPAHTHRKRHPRPSHTPRPLRTRLGQQPTVTQLQH